MRVRCLRTALTREELDHIGPVWPRSNFHDLVEGQTSLVFGIYTYNGAVWLRIESKSGRMSSPTLVESRDAQPLSAEA